MTGTIKEPFHKDRMIFTLLQHDEIAEEHSRSIDRTVLNEYIPRIQTHAVFEVFSLEHKHKNTN